MLAKILKFLDQNLQAGAIDVNIMTKLDKENFDKMYRCLLSLMTHMLQFVDLQIVP
jgi:hypothetical protein